MIVTINGQQTTINPPLKLSDCLAKNGYRDMTIAVALNGTFVPKGEHANTALNDGDDIEIVAPMQGG